jgi:S-adenosylmethionine synthetase
MEPSEHQELVLDMISLQLRKLTKERKRVEKANDTFTLLFAPLAEQSEKVPTWEEH